MAGGLMQLVAYGVHDYNLMEDDTFSFSMNNTNVFVNFNLTFNDSMK